MSAIESALFTVCLDDYTLPPRSKEQDVLDGHMINIAGGINGKNRWFDKSMSLIVENNGRAGMNGEHSFVEALVPSIVADYTLYEDMPVNASIASQQQSCRSERLRWVLDDHIISEIKSANSVAERILNDSEPSELLFSEFGVDWMKEVGEVSLAVLASSHEIESRSRARCVHTNGAAISMVQEPRILYSDV